ncbi:hypothetical protein PoB_000033800 [Plakobranchus ocellatus]|uniref:Uncharacterized protein n=1 Tax=Plakobranchus ocellatus TaxID=259542 RepID=A0AAV3XTP9_9GAST|nr:hypothetical protein PoB_000033800 [Plakobranchus ocellatus]
MIVAAEFYLISSSSAMTFEAYFGGNAIYKALGRQWSLRQSHLKGSGRRKESVVTVAGSMVKGEDIEKGMSQRERGSQYLLRSVVTDPDSMVKGENRERDEAEKRGESRCTK